MGNEHHTLESATAMMPTMLKQLGELVECESPSNSPEALRNCAQLLAPWLDKALGRPVDLVWSGENVHLVAQAPRPRVLVVGHFDTVWPLGTITEWRFQIADDGIATGPGVFDMKAGIVQRRCADSNTAITIDWATGFTRQNIRTAATTALHSLRIADGIERFTLDNNELPPINSLAEHLTRTVGKNATE
ncbi:MAG: cpg2 [Nocardia sp.]|uniref:hypothetical protein n=1 Tax=Nocardia sp. TaxID=1821 RepID=UPI002626B4C2|nr:hypothetical protein [Nocardia sp.]MCU1645429.1 cpg2 [Nocardia sp.]